VRSLSDPRITKLLKSTQSAFPLGRDPWEDLARGLFATREEIGAWIAELQTSGILLGLCAEPNVQHPEIGESLDFAEHGIEPTRWAAACNEGVLVSRWRLRDRGMPGWQAEKWFKIGIMVDVGTAPDQWDPLAASGDRTMIPESPPKWQMAEERFEVHLAPLSRLHTLDARRLFWESLGDGDQARAALQQLLILRLARRFSVRLNPAALGWKGCGLACWSLDPTDAVRAAGALAAVVCTGDVAIRKPTTEWPYNLSAVIHGHAPGSGKKTAAEISHRWGRDLGRWIDFQSLG
jgi:hypothetical protein